MICGNDFLKKLFMRRRIFLYGKGYVINKFILNIKKTIIFLKRLTALVI